MCVPSFLIVGDFGDKKTPPPAKGRRDFFAVPPKFSRLPQHPALSRPVTGPNPSGPTRPQTAALQRRRSKRNFPPLASEPRFQPVARFLWPGGAGVLLSSTRFASSYHKAGVGSRGRCLIFFKGRPLAPVFACFFKAPPCKSIFPVHKSFIESGEIPWYDT